MSGPNDRNLFTDTAAPLPELLPPGNLPVYSQAELDADWNQRWAPATALLYIASVGICAALVSMAALLIGGLAGR